ncbi:hypothetical protein D3C81_1480010 [compost metagenome]
MLTSTIWPIIWSRRACGTPGSAKLTTRLFSVRPCSSVGSLRAGPSTRMRCTVPTMPWLMRCTFSSMAACSRWRRRSFTSCGVSSCRLAAGVPGRGLKMNENEVS